MARSSCRSPVPGPQIPPRLARGRKLVVAPRPRPFSAQRPHSPGSAARVLPRLPEAVCSRPREPPRSAGARPGLLFVAAAGPAPRDAARDAAGRALAEPGGRDVGETNIREKTEGFKLKTPRREFSESSLVLANSDSLKLGKQRWVDRAGEDRAQPIAGTRPGRRNHH